MNQKNQDQLPQLDLYESYRRHLKYSRFKDQYTTTRLDQYFALALAVRDRIIDHWVCSREISYTSEKKRIYYLSLEFLMGKLFENNILNLDLEKEVLEVCKAENLDYDDLREAGEDAGLGNGGLGRLAACFMDSLATLGYSAMGYGIRYDYGIFRQEIMDGFQQEEPDLWLRHGNPWEVPSPEHTQVIRFGGRVERSGGTRSAHYEWVDCDEILAVPYDTPVVGFRNQCINTLRLWSAKATEEFNLANFNEGDYFSAVQEKNDAEKISKILYPNDNNFEGKALRFKQQYFFVSASIQDIVRRYKKNHQNFEEFHIHNAIQLNDTHPALSVLELMRILIDDEGLSWEKAWEITRKTCAYTNHTLLPEALEKWSVEFFEKFLPRHLLILFEINRLFLRDVSLRFPADQKKIVEMSLFQETPEKMVRMAYLSIVGSHSVNGVAKLHSDLLKTTLLKDFYDLYPQRFNNKTNGVTPRRWLYQCNPGLSALICEKIGEKWITHLDELRKLEKFADDASFLSRLQKIKRDNKISFAQLIEKEHGIRVSPDSIFDVQIKRLHEYKRQLLNVLHAVILWQRLKANPGMSFQPMTLIFAGKAAPGYFMAKLIIKLINSVAEFINNDPSTNSLLKVFFMKNYRISLAEKIFPASDLSEQISTAGMEASGTGNMKFAMNGALTIGTMDGANVEMAEEIGEENLFIFGLSADEVNSLRASRQYSPWDIYHENREIRQAIDLIASGFFSPDKKDLFRPIVQSLLENGDYYFILADLVDYDRAKMQVNALYSNPDVWARKSLLNIARMGKFSSDRTIEEYAREIWDAKTIFDK